METKYNIVELFTSIQGEGKMVGTKMFFIRLLGCNLSCSFCDEPKHKDNSLVASLSVDTIVNKAKKAKVEWVCITGGEPTLQNVNPLILALKKIGLSVAVESNGYKPTNIQTADFLTLSPKRRKDVKLVDASFDDKLKWDEVKVVVGRDAQSFFTIRESDTDLVDLLFSVSDTVFVQPLNESDTINRDNLNYAINLVDAHPRLRLSAQLHKMIGVE
jgi:organic radical activating enzyme